MCKAFSLLITKRNKVYWKAGVNSHEDLRELFKKDKDLKDNTDAPNNTFARIEINPNNGNYLEPDKWVYKIDQSIIPNWLNKTHEKLAFKALEDWKKEVYTFNVQEAIKPIQPFLRKAPSKITKVHLEALKEWGLVRGLVRDSVWDSVRDSVRDSVGDSVWDSVRDLVLGHIGSLFPNIKKWKYVNNRKSPFQKIKGYPFRSAVKLWKLGLVPSYDGKVWRLHGSPKGDGRIVTLWEGKI
jgi:hypothetical protein